MVRARGWRLVWGVVAFCAVMASPSRAQVTLTTLVNFDGTNGSGPWALTQAADGNFYGTTAGGGANSGCPFSGGGCGTFFKMAPDGKLTTLYNFCSMSHCSDGFTPAGSLVRGFNGDLYGTTQGGGAHSSGTVFKITTTGKLTTLYSFCALVGCVDGEVPTAGLVQAANGHLYGTTRFGGTAAFGAAGTVFEIAPTGKLTTLYSFCTLPYCADGEQPFGGLLEGANGNLYGTTIYNGAGTYGSIFEITPAGKLNTLFSFDGIDGAYPVGGLIQAANGAVYGVTAAGGVSSECPNSQGCGTVFKLTSDDRLTTLYNFCSLTNCVDGLAPVGPLVQASDGNLYGVTNGIGGQFYNDGTIFEINAPGRLTTLYAFCPLNNCAAGAFPPAGMVQATSGLFYGTSANGGEGGAGTVFSLSTGLGPFVSFVRAAGKVGQTGGILGQGFTGTTSVMLNGTPVTFTVKSDTYITATVPEGATTGYVTVTTPGGMLTSNVPFQVIQ